MQSSDALSELAWVLRDQFGWLPFDAFAGDLGLEWREERSATSVLGFAAQWGRVGDRKVVVQLVSFKDLVQEIWYKTY